MAKTKKSSLTAKLGSAGRKGFDKHKGDTTSFDTGGNLPAGIEGGIAQLVDCRFSVFKKGDNKGEYFFRAEGIVKSPVEFNGVRIEGLRTAIQEPLHATPSRSRVDVGEHFEWILNEMRKLGLDTSDVDYSNLEEVAKALKQSQPHFRFRTWIGDKTDAYPNPRTNHVWGGQCEYEEDGEPDDVIDETEEEEEEEVEGESEEVVIDEADLDALAEAADLADEDGEEAEKLAELAKAAGVDHEAIDSWTGVAAAIKEAADDNTEDDDDDEEEETVPEKAEIYFYKPPKKRKPVECEVTAVFAGKKTVSLKNLDDGKSYKAVPWDKLETE